MVAYHNNPIAALAFCAYNTTGSPSSKYEHRQTSALLRNIYYFGGARSKGFATLRNVSKLHFFDKIGKAKYVGFRFYLAI